MFALCYVCVCARWLFSFDCFSLFSLSLSRENTKKIVIVVIVCYSTTLIIATVIILYLHLVQIVIQSVNNNKLTVSYTHTMQSEKKYYQPQTHTIQKSSWFNKAFSMALQKKKKSKFNVHLLSMAVQWQNILYEMCLFPSYVNRFSWLKINICDQELSTLVSHTHKWVHTVSNSVGIGTLLIDRHHNYV